MAECRFQTWVVAATIAACVLICASRAWADDSGVYAVGGSVRMLDNVPGIQMESEYVRATAFPDLDSIYVECIFCFNNLGPAREILVGFPEDSWGDVGEGKPFKDFHSFVNGQEVQVVRSSLPDSALTPYEYFHWWTKKIDFRAGERTVIRNTYSAEPGGTSDGSSWFCYTLWTGASWDGTIGVADIVVDVVDPKDRYELSTRPAASYSSEREFRWHFENFEPSRSSDLGRLFVTWKPRGN